MDLVISHKAAEGTLNCSTIFLYHLSIILVRTTLCGCKLHAPSLLVLG